MKASPSARGRAVLLTSFNSGPMLETTAGLALQHWPDVRVVIDGSSDASGQAIRAMTARHPGLRLLELPQNRGKGGAVLEAALHAHKEGITHLLVMDADGQHPADPITHFMELSILHPEAMILGVPEFGPDAPRARVHGRRAGNFFTSLETLWGGVKDSLFGFRLYPVEPLLRVMQATRRGRRFDFDTEVVVRLFWEGVRPISRRVPVRYPPAAEGGVTHFCYVRDNMLLVSTHAGLCLSLVPRFLKVWRLSKRWRAGLC